MQMPHKHTNRLIKESSPYLLQHAHNPVDWYSWGEEALQKAKQEDKPILVSIGYAACHWCHVMEKESFENEETASLMNEHFINIKIDREERPDLDHIYMDAVQAMTGSGGWPLNVFLTPEGKPFYGGTYFPPVAITGRISWTDLLGRISQIYHEKKEEIRQQADSLTNHLVAANTFKIEQDSKLKDIDFSAADLDLIEANILLQADTEWGGFGKAPKFPQTFSIRFLLRHYHFTKDEKALKQALLSLDKMIMGGIYDQLGGGFARYSTDEKWLAPHFEKMLYDNALLVEVMAEAYQLTQKKIYAEAIRETMQFVKRELQSAENGFYSALDADSEGVEGKFYTWSWQEVVTILGDQAPLFCEVYNVREGGNWENTNILWLPRTLEQFAESKNISLGDLRQMIDTCKEKLMFERSKRVRPNLDDKILLGWNALMNMACSKAYEALGEEGYRQMAIDNMKFLEQNMKAKGTEWFHTYKNGEAKIAAFLDDYAFLIQAYIHLQQISGDASYLLKAKEITELVMMHFREESSGYFFYTHQHQTDVILRKKEVYDGALPSGNAVMALNLFYLSVVFDVREWRNHAEKITLALHSAIVSYPTSFGVWASFLQWLIYGANELVIVGEGSFDKLLPVLKLYNPNKIIQAAETDQSGFPMLKGKFKEEGIAFYRCKNYLCDMVINNVENFLQICNT
jgi:uncharacterized protein YyaL (SSP411 family)